MTGVDNTVTSTTKWSRMYALRGRAGFAWLWCLWGALAACLWIRTAAPVDSFQRLETAAADGDVVSADRGHAHDPARQPNCAPIESESEEQVGDDGEDGHVVHHARFDEASQRHIAPMGCEVHAVPRDPCTSQQHSRGPPQA